MRTKDWLFIAFSLLIILTVIYITKIHYYQLGKEAEHQKSQSKIDSLENIAASMRLKQDSIIKEYTIKDSISNKVIDKLKSQFNEKQKAKILDNVSTLNDSSTVLFLSEWLSKVDTLGR